MRGQTEWCGSTKRRLRDWLRHLRDAHRARAHGGVLGGASAVDGRHAAFFVAFAGGRGEVVEPFDLHGAQLDAVGGGVLLYAGDPLGSRDRGDVVALRE
jgi:hypothetical protein